VGLRLVFIFAVTFLLEIPFLQLAGGVLLIWVAVRLARQPLGADTEVPESTTLLGAISTIVIADAVMSLDNVLAVAGAAHGDRLLALFGVALSLPIVVGGSGLVATLMNRFGWVVALAGGVLGYVAGEMIVEDRAVQGWMAGREALELTIPLGLGLGIVGLGLRSLRIV
jgi:YjbE family integral membrane protein